EVYGIARARALEDEIVRRFVGPDYGWMWPFPSTVRRWVRDFVDALEGQESAPPPTWPEVW
ncbi:MAG TPA: hypothetical protein VKU41_22080, partial [Polyangiaceae bacterium]|nr:hypothetical protein [Polyangiaceae bacterium]